MICFEACSADAVWRQATERLRADGILQESRDQATRELLHATFTVTDPRQRLVFARPLNPALAIAEVIWIMAGANDADFLRFWNPRLRLFVDDRDPHVLHGAYGYRLGSQPRLSEACTALRHASGTGTAQRLDQLKAAYQALAHTSHSRQVVLQIWDSDLDLPNPVTRAKDIPCNLASHLLVRDGKLEWLQVMRSNDLMWGTPYNFVQFTAIQEIMAGWLGLDVGTYNHVSDSLHVYQRHWAELDSITTSAVPLPSNQADLRVGPYGAWEAMWEQIVDSSVALTQYADSASLVAIFQQFSRLPLAYVEWGAVLTAEALRRRRHEAAAKDIIINAGPYWGASWERWLTARHHPSNPMNGRPGSVT